MNEGFWSCPTVRQARTTIGLAEGTNDSLRFCLTVGQDRGTTEPTTEPTGDTKHDFPSCLTVGQSRTTTKPGEGLGSIESFREAAPHIEPE